MTKLQSFTGFFYISSNLFFYKRVLQLGYSTTLVTQSLFGPCNVMICCRIAAKRLDVKLCIVKRSVLSPPDKQKVADPFFSLAVFPRSKAWHSLQFTSHFLHWLRYVNCQLSLMLKNTVTTNETADSNFMKYAAGYCLDAG